jgi:putative FmdB family regulatory protein
MPLLEYSCKACGCQFEFLTRGTAATAAPECPDCHGVDLERLLSGFAVSSHDASQARVEAARRQRRHSKDATEQKIAAAEYRKTHQH